MFSIVILTHNEQIDIEACIRSVAWADDVLVFDSFSTDRTAEIALNCGARLMRHKFEDYASQRNAALALGQFRHEWVFMLDADERFTPELREEIEEALCRQPHEHVLYRVRRKDYLNGIWIRGSSGYPTWFGRLIRRGQVNICRTINEQYVPLGSVGFLNEHVVHFPFSKGTARWLARHNDYSSLEAQTLGAERQGPVPWRSLVSPDPAERRTALKKLYYRVPARPLLIFIYLYIIRMGFLEGRSGLYFASLRMTYEIMINVKYWLGEHKPPDR